MKTRKFGNFYLNNDNTVDFNLGNITLEEEDLYYLKLLLDSRDKQFTKKK